MTKPIFSKKRFLIPILLLFILLAGVGVATYYSLKPFTKIPEIIQSKKDSGWERLTMNGYKTVICKKDILNPINVTITSINGKENPAFAIYTNLTRDNIFADFKTNDYQGASGNTKFSETDLNKVAKWYEQKGCDYFKTDGNYEGSTFSYNPPISDSQILQTQRTETFIQKQTENIQTLKTGTPEEKIKVLEYDISRGNGFISAFQKGEKTYENQPLTPELIETVKTQIADRQSQIEQIKKENP